MRLGSLSNPNRYREVPLEWVFVDKIGLDRGKRHVRETMVMSAVWSMLTVVVGTWNVVLAPTKGKVDG